LIFRNKIYKIYIMPKRSSRKNSRKMIGCSMMGGNGAAEYGGKVYGGIGEQHAGLGNMIAMKGGNGAAQYGVTTYGAAGLQHAVPGQGNRIAMNGGNCEEGGDPQEGGNTVVGNLLVPAGLFVASRYAQRISKKRGGKRVSRKSRRNRRSRRRP